MGVGTQASCYEVTARHRRRRPALPILTPPANPGLRVATATEPQPRVPHARAVDGPVWSLRARATDTRAPGVEAASVSVSGAGETQGLAETSRPPASTSRRGRAVSKSGQHGLYFPLNKYTLKHGREYGWTDYLGF